MPTGPAEIIIPPVLLAFPAGLLRAATVIGHDDLHFGSAIEWSPENAADAQVVDPCAVLSKGTAGNHPATIRYDAFAVEAHDICGTFGFGAAEYEARARRTLAARESKAVEREWWTGTLSSANPHLAKAVSTNGPATTTLSGGAAQSLRVAFALLVQALADLNAGPGMIHARPFLCELWGSLQLVRRDSSGKLRSACGVQVVAGAGYPGTGPAAEARTATSEWAYATDDVVVHQGDVGMPARGVNAETLDRTTNTNTNRAERAYALAFNGAALVAVNVNPTQAS